MTLRTLSLLFCLLIASPFVFAQVPSIQSVTPLSAKPGTTLVIKGTNFNTLPAHSKVFFGASWVPVLSASSTQLNVKAPYGSYYGPITVLDFDTQLSVTSNFFFKTTFAGPAKIQASDYDAPYTRSTGSSPSMLLVQDFYQRGNPDLATLNNGDNMMAEYPNESAKDGGAFNFNGGRQTATGKNPQGMCLADINGEGSREIIVTNRDDNTLSVLSDGALSGSFATGPQPGAVAAADFDGDGRIDIAVANTGDNTISILRNAGNSYYTDPSHDLLAKIDLPAGLNPQSITATDLDGDGKPELIIANTGDNSIWVYPNIAVAGNISSASFGPKIVFATGNAPIQVVTGDIDGDGKPDLLVVNSGATNISVLRNTSAGSVSFAAKSDLPTPLIPLHLSLGDLDGDGRVDAAISWANSTKLSLFRNTSTPGTFNFDANVDLETGSLVRFSAIADLNKDGVTDVIAGSTAANTLYIFRNHLITPPPVITSFSPQQGPNGATVIIKGTDLTGATAVSFGGVPAASFTVNSPTQITAIVGLGATGKVSVTNPRGTTELPGFTFEGKPAFTYAGPQVYKKGVAIATLAPQHTGGAASDYTLTAQDFVGGVAGLKDGTGALAEFNGPVGMVIDKNGNFYVADKLNARIRKITPAGVVTTFAGNDPSATFAEPTGLAIDAAGNIYVADALNNKIRKITPAGEVSTLAGSGQQGSADGPALTATFNYPTGVAVDATGTLFVADCNNNVIRKITPDGMVSRYSGTLNNPGDFDGDINQAGYSKPYTLTIDKKGNMYVMERASGALRIINPQQNITTLTNFSGMSCVAVDADDNIYASTGQEIIKINSSGKLTVESTSFGGDGMVTAPDGSIYICGGNSIKKLVYSPAYTITPALPAGLSMDIGTGTITGIPTVTSPQTTYKITAGNASGTATANVTLSVTETNPQPPVITSFTPTNGPLGTTVTITGTGFSATAANNIVYFGATKGMVAGGSTKELLVIVPAGATYSVLTVLNTETELTAYATRPFTVTFPSTHKIEADDFEAKVEFRASTNLQTLAITDLDGDGKPDMVVTDWTDKTVSAYRNTTNNDGINTQSFAQPVLFDTGLDPWQVTAGDLDGDGKPDLVVANYGTNYISVYRNTSTKGNISFAPRVDIYSGVNPVTVAIGDLDADGKPEIVVGNSISKTISVFKNFTPTGNISAESFVREMDIPAGPQPSDIQLADMDGDGKPDIVYSNANTGGFNVLRSKAVKGSLSADSFYPRVNFPGVSQSQNLTIGDLDGDNKPDVVVTNQFNGSISIYRNISTSGGINAGSIAAPVNIQLPFPQDVEMGDIDGDGKPDLVIANSGRKSISVLRNNTSAQGIDANSFMPEVNLKTSNVYDAAIADLDGDGKPEVIGSTDGSITVFRYEPHEVITAPLAFGPIPPKTLCSPDFDPGATSSAPITYTSDNPAVATIVSGKVHIVDVGTATITANDGCTTQQQTLTVTNIGATPTVSISSNPSTACDGMDVTFNATAQNAGLSPTYQWALNGAAAGTSIATFSVTGMKSTDVVTCSVTNNDGCVPTTSGPVRGNIDVSINSSVSLTIASSQQGPTCPGTTVIFTATPAYSPSAANFDTGDTRYQWFVNGIATGNNSPQLITRDLKDGDYVYCNIAVGGKCIIGPTAASNVITAAISPAAQCRTDIPNTFTPNGDGINDTWRLDNLYNASTSFSVTIYNRYGAQLFYAATYAKPWDGTYKGKPVSVGVYYYVILLKDTGKTLSGWVSVIR